MKGTIVRTNIPYQDDCVAIFHDARTKYETRKLIGKNVIYETMQDGKIRKFRGKVTGLFGQGFGVVRINFGFRLSKESLGKEVRLVG